MAPKKKQEKEPEPEPEPELPPEPQEGEGAFLFPNGSRYEGKWQMKDGAKQRHGQGVYTDTLEGHTYEGEWLNDKMHGRGTFRYASNARYEGEFVNNQYHGHGIYTFPNGSFYEGPFEENQMHGEGKYTDTKGVLWQGKFYNGVGPGIAGSAQAVAN
mmetsp:Transcript_28451/g.62284  ORF Transcript_28451/g.62284 Transcript_28451/m.62284 type:complete len:157 (-) Transcript_28451:518-988(-)